MVAHKRHTDDVDFYLYDRKIEKVRSFCYLGLELNSADSFKLAIERLHSKTLRAYMSLRRQFNFYNGTSVLVMITLFKSTVKSILLYGSELWGIMGWRTNNVTCIKNYILLRKNVFEQFHGRLCKQVLGVHR